MIEVKFTGNTMAEVIASIGEFVDTISPFDTKIDAPPASQTGLVTPTEKPKEPRKPRKITQEQPKAATAAAGKGAAEPTSSPAAGAAKPVEEPKAAAAAPKAPKLADAQAALTSFFDKNGIEKSRALLQSFGVGKVQELKPEQFAEFIAKAAE